MNWEFIIEVAEKTGKFLASMKIMGYLRFLWMLELVDSHLSNSKALSISHYNGY